jgi:6-pyruvoyltetrahydropterin/6-carboxytetrahydropterin synthase
MYQLKVKSTFSAAHAVRFKNGCVEPLHGHNWKLIVCVASSALDECAMVVDFEELKKLTNDLILNKLDHSDLNAIPAFKGNATCEAVAKWIYDELESPVAKMSDGIKLESVTLWEAQDCCVTYSTKNN